MTTAPTVFDRALVRKRLARAIEGRFAGFLLERAALDLEERLSAVSRPFPLAVDIGTPTPIAAEIVARSRPGTAIARIAPAPGPASFIPTALGDEERLPIGPESVDLAVSLLALQSVNDLPGALLQIRRALRPDGLLLACLFGGDTLTELRQAFAAAEAEMEGGASPRVAPFADVRSLGGLLQRAGFALPVVDLETVTVRYRDAFRLMQDLRAMGLTNALAERRRAPLRRATLIRMAAFYAERFADPDGRIRATFDIVWLSGWAPHESQQKPLRPGSAQARLADALGVREHRPDMPSGGEGGTG
ncbi:methyltransferase domain-containing protein [Enterovirga aerilata]|uniref:Methyltransferase domain-containing protein n=1 Tax=Enterovirga aerilata TaxID=2730920 RepID=A0A849IBD7_9HYPH|nr:methyltransferase domain-containing protein [Enterovirga sp. DB1703]NNM71243.1 methyltransferase domain-containing protein [Enterovirga sp. DB1703]